MTPAGIIVPVGESVSVTAGSVENGSGVEAGGWLGSDAGAVEAGTGVADPQAMAASVSIERNIRMNRIEISKKFRTV